VAYTWSLTASEVNVLEHSEYIDIFTSAERLHRTFLDVIQAELDALQYRDINNIRALILLNIGDIEMTASELLWRGCYLGSNVSYNLKKLTETGYVIQTRSSHDKRVIMVRNSAKGLALCKCLQAMSGRHIDQLTNGSNNTSLEDIVTWRKTMRNLERFCSRAVERAPRIDAQRPRNGAQEPARLAA
jgi:DNA-binding MarR family transcriptional regulator